MEFIDYYWESYENMPQKTEKKQEQTQGLIETGLYAGANGAEFTFIPTLQMEQYNIEIERNYNQIKIIDHKAEICSETYYTSKIEGSHTTYKRTIELYDGNPVDHNDYYSEMMILGGFNATKLLNLHNNKLDENLLLKAWEVLTDGARENESVKGPKYRNGNVYVGRHMGLSPAYIQDAMNSWFTFYDSDKLEDYPFIKASLLHYSFESIHPFCDGNGRIGRLIMQNYLISRGYEKFKSIAVSKKIAETINGYYNVFNLSDNVYSDCTPFIEYMLQSFDNALYDLLELQNNKNQEKGTTRL